MKSPLVNRITLSVLAVAAMAAVLVLAGFKTFTAFAQTKLECYNESAATAQSGYDSCLSTYNTNYGSCSGNQQCQVQVTDSYSSCTNTVSDRQVQQNNEVCETYD